MGWKEQTHLSLGSAMRHFGEGDRIVYRPDGSDRTELVAVFRSAHVEIDAVTGASTGSNEPSLGVRLADLPSAPRMDDVVEVNGVRYVVAEPPQNDGEGGATLMLKREANP